MKCTCVPRRERARLYTRAVKQRGVKDAKRYAMMRPRRSRSSFYARKQRYAMVPFCLERILHTFNIVSHIILYYYHYIL